MSVSVFSIVKENVSALQAAQQYGLKVNPKGMACCPFHRDKSPSMKVDRRYYCFGCGATGDAVDLTAQLLGIAPRDAALRLADDFGIDVGEKAVRKRNQVRAPVKSRADPQKEAAEWITKSVRMLLNYRWKLFEWKQKYAPSPLDEEWHPLFCESLDKMEWVEYLLDELLFCGKDQYQEMKICHGEGVRKLEGRLEQLLERERRYDQRDQGSDEKNRQREGHAEHEQLSESIDDGSSSERGFPNESADRTSGYRKGSGMETR